MAILAIGVLLLAQCFAFGLGHHGSHPHHVRADHSVTSSKTSKDRHDNTHSKDWTIPDVKFIYNYEQMRRDQPTQIEQRRDNLDNYLNENLYTTSSTTTTTIQPVMQNYDNPLEINGAFDAPIVVLQSPSHHHHHHHHHHHSKRPNHTVPSNSSSPEKQEDDVEGPRLPTNSWDAGKYQSPFPAKMPPPPTLPKWDELNELLTQHPYHQNMLHLPTSHVIGHKLPNEPIIPQTQNTKSPKKHKHSTHHIPTKHNRIDIISATEKQILDEVRPSTHRGHVRNRPQHIHRGNHKFNWNDITQTPTPVFSRNTLKPIPPVPTLSPWYDGFGK